MKYTLLVLPLLASVASAQDDVWKSLADGDRVQITFRSGNMIMGSLARRPTDPRIKQPATDYATVTELTLDVSLEYPGLNGTMTIPKKEIKEVRKIATMDATTMKRVREELQRIQQQSASDEASRKSAESERDKAAKADREKYDKELEANKSDKDKGAALLKEFNEQQDGKKLLERFPPDKWKNALKEIGDKSIRKQPLTIEEREFLEVQGAWAKALNAAEAEKKEGEKKEEKKEKAEEKKQ
jgi:hypothetical protein